MAGRIIRLLPTAKNNGIGTPPLGLFTHHFRRIPARSVDPVFQSEAFCYFKPLGIQIGSNYRGPRPLGQHAQNDADWTLADYQDGLALVQAQRLECPSCRC